MFTGIIEAIGHIAELRPAGGDLSVRVQTGSLSLDDVALGDSIATNGVCLTVVALPGDGFWADVSQETISKTTAQHWQVGQSVNLEKALMPTSRLGGHLVSGHVDGIGEVVSHQQRGRAWQLVINAPGELAKYIAQKGSITVDGTSLTVNEVQGRRFELTIVPHTLTETVIDGYQTGTLVNLEVDLIARYLERLLQGSTEASPLTEQFLKQHGYHS